MGGDVFLEAGEGEGAGGFDDGARVFEDVFDRGAGFVCGDVDDGVDYVAAEAEGFGANRFHGCAVGEETHFGEDDGFACAQGGGHGVCVVGFHADDLHVGGDALDVDSYPCNETAAADAAEDGFEFLQVRLAEEFHADCPLAGDDVRVVEGGDVDQAVGCFEAAGFGFGGVEVVAF